MELKRLTTYLTAEQHEKLRLRSFEQNVTMAELVRQAVDNYLKFSGEGDDMLSKELLKEIREHIQAEAEMLRDVFDYRVILEGDKVVEVMKYLPRHCSTNGTYEPPWAGNIEGLEMHILSKYELNYEERQQAIEVAKEEALKYITHTDHVFSEQYGCNVEYATYSDCAEEEFQRAIDAILDAPEYQRKSIEHPGHYYEIIDTTAIPEEEDD